MGIFKLGSLQIDHQLVNATTGQSFNLNMIVLNKINKTLQLTHPVNEEISTKHAET